MHSICDKILKLFYPSRCAFCGKVIENNRMLCNFCETEAKCIEQSCTKCGLPKENCRCRVNNYLFAGAIGVFLNEGIAQRGIYNLKFNERYSAADFFASKMAQLYTKHFPNVVADFVCPVPMHKSGLVDRGYNQADLLAKRVAKNLKTPYKHNLLEKCVKTKTQHSITSYKERVENVKGAYKATTSLDGKTVLLIDDIRTSAATLNECSKQLRLAGATNVYCLTALVTVNENKKEK